MAEASTHIPQAGHELPAELSVYLRQHQDFDNGGRVRRWAEVLEPRPASQTPSFIDKVLANSAVTRQVTETSETPKSPEDVLEEAFQNLLGFWPIPRRGLEADLGSLGYSIEGLDAASSLTIAPIRLKAASFLSTTPAVLST